MQFIHDWFGCDQFPDSWHKEINWVVQSLALFTSCSKVDRCMCLYISCHLRRSPCNVLHNCCNTSFHMPGIFIHEGFVKIEHRFNSFVLSNFALHTKAVIVVGRFSNQQGDIYVTILKFSFLKRSTQFPELSLRKCSGYFTFMSGCQKQCFNSCEQTQSTLTQVDTLDPR